MAGEAAKPESLQDRLIDDLRRRHIELAAGRAWALQVAEALARPPRGWARWLPAWLWRRKLAARVERRGLFDGEAYLARYPEVAAAGMDPLTHFLGHGLVEGRAGLPVVRPGVPAPGLVAEILACGLFDPAWYCARHGLGEMAPADAVVDYLRESTFDPLRDPGPLFSGAWYILRHDDLRGIHPLEHVLRFGLREGRALFDPVAADAFMAGAAGEGLAPLAGFFAADRRVVVLCWKDGNFFFEDIARYLVSHLGRLGFVAELRHDDGGLADEGHDFVVVAPHEYCVHGPGAQWGAARRAAAIHVNTEQWHTGWFALALGKMLDSRRALDINPASARGLARLGISAGFLPLLPAAGGPFDVPRAGLTAQTTALRDVLPLSWPEDAAARPYDVLFVGTMNDRRGEVLARLAPQLAGRDCFIHAPRLAGPVTASHPDMIPAADVAQLARNAKVLLNIHQGESRYFPWHRLFLAGIAEGCVVVTEPCVATGVLVAGVHYLEAEAGEMGAMLDWLLGTDDGRARMAAVRRDCAALCAGLMAG